MSTVVTSSAYCFDDDDLTPHFAKRRRHNISTPFSDVSEYAPTAQSASGTNSPNPVTVSGIHSSTAEQFLTDPAPEMPQPSDHHDACETCGACPTFAEDQHEDRALEEAIQTSFASGEVGATGWCEETLIHVITRDLEDTCDANEGCDAAIHDPNFYLPDKIKMFYSPFKQPFELEFYVRRLVQYTNCSASGFVVAMVYLDRLQQLTPGLRLTYLNCHRLLMTALCLAAKYIDDEVYSNAYYARVGGLQTAELNKLEAVMLDMLGWKLHVSPDTYALFEDSLISAVCSLDSDDDDNDDCYSDVSQPGSPVSQE